MSPIRPLVPLLVTAGILLGGNGLQGTVIALRGAQEGFSPSVIGFLGTTYFAGFLLGCMSVTRMLRAVGHIRVFAALAAIASSIILLMALFIEPTVWAVGRFVSGICFAGLFTTMESWINSASTNQNRARALSFYRIVDISSVVGMQYVMAATGTADFTIFALLAMLFSLSLVPVSIGDRSNPTAPSDMRLDLRKVWRISPLACFGCAAIGITNSAFRLVGPVYAQMSGFSVTQVAIFMSAGIIGGAVMQYPVGYFSDRLDRRRVMIITTSGALFTGLAIAFFAGRNPAANFILVLAFGSFAMPLYSLSVAHANDHASRDDYVRLAAGLLFFYSIGAIIGPLGISFLMQRFGPGMLFLSSSVIYAILIGVTLVRMQARSAVPISMRKRFVPLLRTSPMFMKLVRRHDGGESRAHSK